MMDVRASVRATPRRRGGSANGRSEEVVLLLDEAGVSVRDEGSAEGVEVDGDDGGKPLRGEPPEHGVMRRAG